MRKVILAYHSVSGRACPAVAGSFPIPIERFAAQVDGARAKGWSIGRVSQLFDPVNRDTIYITGDDGTIDWARNVLPWCEEHRIATHTAIVTGPWLDPPIYPITHRVQVVLALRNHDIPTPALTDEQIEYIDRVYSYETDPRRRYLKGACNLVLDSEEASQLLGPPLDDELRLLADRFAAPEVYQPFHYAEFGVHTVGHRALAHDVDAHVRDEILPCRTMLSYYGLRVTDVFTLPMCPRLGATVEQLVKPLTAAGFRGIFDGRGEWDQRSFVIPRIDAKHVETHLGLPPWKGS